MTLFERTRVSKRVSASQSIIGSDRARFPPRGVCTNRLRVPVSTRRNLASARSRSTGERGRDELLRSANV